MNQPTSEEVIETTEDDVSTIVDAETEAAEDTATEDTATEPEAGGNREAAKWRTRLREVEAERDSLRDRVTAMQRAEAERIAGRHISTASAIWAAGVDLETLLDDEGRPDEAKVKAATAQAKEFLGLATPLPSNYVPSEGGGSYPRFDGNDWQSAFSLR